MSPTTHTKARTKTAKALLHLERTSSALTKRSGASTNCLKGLKSSPSLLVWRLTQDSSWCTNPVLSLTTNVRRVGLTTLYLVLVTLSVTTERAMTMMSKTKSSAKLPNGTTLAKRLKSAALLMRRAWRTTSRSRTPGASGGETVALLVSTSQAVGTKEVFAVCI